ncbi:hypothetical protein SPRG_10213 [Saprolegnia parasitica CBS 223.65]|uniref:Uncharacterized protein n=1 Tax=Saprolegnia parasitica (strain CBS 223.65) TaxID=695850 RepID=A0A067C6D8_SAPPC|nr:hypothetical protein SPRG_10213 [Saprolegnia parasitica CBS 223.65]KDO24680.1 hypothetical protein SPRG_10213 [Saprolegnia parasitica CBS 223.65]|eukprot:XP_012204561.1 hypothetical protein SPRG_10213 [Saprolegnia parasitica CBS 223.65]
MEPADGPAYTPATCGLEESHVIYLNQNRLTCADVLATTVTVEKLLVPQTSLHELGARQQSTKKLKLPPPAAPMTLPMPRKRMNKILMDERDAFLKQLVADREARAAREHWASTRIQSIFRGYRHRPRPLHGYERKRRTNVIVAIRRDLQDMQRILVHTPSATLGDGGSTLPTWRREVHAHAMGKREAKHRRDRLASAATKIQACVKRFLARVGYGHLVSRRMDEIVLVSAVVIQASFRGYVVRKQTALELVALQSIAIVRIQALVRASRTSVSAVGACRLSWYDVEKMRYMERC